MGKNSRRKHLWRNIQQRRITDTAGRDGLVITPPEDWLDLHPDLPDEMADDMVRVMRTAGIILWLHPDPNGTVRTRMMFPEGSKHPPLKVIDFLATYARALGKALARSGDFQPPPDNPWGDQPLPPGGHWDWSED
jgi:hypothetical protein